MPNSYRVLIVDDESIQRSLIRETLAASDIDFIVEEAADGWEALQKINDSRMDVVLLDKHLPILNGDDLCQMVRRNIKNRLLPIIMISGASEIEELARSFTFGVTDFIRKPYNPVELISRITAALSV